MKIGPALRVTNLNIGTKRANFKILLLWNWKAQSFDMWYIASPCRPLPSLFIWSPRVKTGSTLVVTSWSIGTKKRIFKFFFSETGRPRALIFFMQHLLVDLYQVCSYDAHGVKSGPSLGVTSWNMDQKRPASKYFISETGRSRYLIFGK